MASIRNAKSLNGYEKYEGASLDVPFFHILLEPFLPKLQQPFIKSFYAFRWTLSRPLETRMLPKWFPVVPLPVLRWIPYVTLGELLLALPIAMLMVWGYSLTFVNPSISPSGNVAGYAILFSFLTANKSNSVFSLIFGIPFERMIPFHNMSALAAVILGGFHTYVAYENGDSSDDNAGGRRGSSSDDRRLSSDGGSYSMTGPDPDFIKFVFDGGTNISGSLLMIAMTGLAVFSFFPIIRRKFFDFWLWTHILLAIGTVVFSVMHSVTLVIIVAVWWGVDVALRYVVMAGCRYPTHASIRKIEPDITEITFAKPPGFAYNPGQFVQIAVSRLSKLQFHPISISSAPSEEDVTLHIKALGKWSSQLLELAEKEDTIEIGLEGPYGSLAVDLDDDEKYKMVLCVSGGIGATHTHSVAKSLLSNHQRGRGLKKIRYVWAVRDMNLVAEMPPPSDSYAPGIISEEMTEAEDTACASTEGLEVECSTTTKGVVISSSKAAESSELLRTDIFMTGQAADDENPDSVDPSCHLHSGRPNLDVIFDEMKEEATRQGEMNIAVFGCGPHKLMDQLRKCCRKHSQGALSCGGVSFDLHTEVFEF